MRFLPGLIFVACASCVFAQTEDPPEVMRAKAGIERLRSLVEAGVAPRAQLAQAEAAIADAEDAALLRRTIYGNDLTDEQAGEMLAAAERRVDRRKHALEEGRKLADRGVASLARIKTLKGLTIRKNSVSDATKQKLREHLPECKIIEN